MTPASLASVTGIRADLAAVSAGRFRYTADFSGHGFLQAPATGEIIRDLYLGVPPFCDISGFDALRFATARQRTELI